MILLVPLSTLYFCLKMLWKGEKRGFRFCVAPCLTIRDHRPVVVAKLQPLHGLNKLCSLLSGVHTCCAVVSGVLLQKKRPMAALLHCCRGTVGTVGLSDILSDCRTMRERPHRGISVGHCRTTVGHCRTVGLSELSDCRITVGHCRNPLSDCRAGAQSGTYP